MPFAEQTRARDRHVRTVPQDCGNFTGARRMPGLSGYRRGHPLRGR